MAGLTANIEYTLCGDYMFLDAGTSTLGKGAFAEVFKGRHKNAVSVVIIAVFVFISCQLLCKWTVQKRLSYPRKGWMLCNKIPSQVRYDQKFWNYPGKFGQGS